MPSHLTRSPAVPEAALFLEPVFQRRIWGGRRLAARFGYDVPDGPVGECWGVSAHANGPAVVRNGTHAGRTLADVWERDPTFFGRRDDGPFPLLVKFLDAADWLSVQVHPSDEEALRLEGVPLGKTECWYVVEAEPGAELILGHRAADRDELTAMVRAGRWDELLERRRVRAGDFVYVPTGTVHAVGPGLLIYEVQQNCDTTYRVYDFDRADAATGQPRELHLDKALQVLRAPYDPATTDTAEAPQDVAGGRRQRLVHGPFFTATRHLVRGDGYAFASPTFEAWTAVDGRGTMNVRDELHPVAAGDHFVLSAAVGEVAFSGDLTLISCRPD